MSDSWPTNKGDHGFDVYRKIEAKRDLFHDLETSGCAVVHYCTSYFGLSPIIDELRLRIVLMVYRMMTG